jgi:hypothetical protein
MTLPSPGSVWGSTLEDADQFRPHGSPDTLEDGFATFPHGICTPRIFRISFEKLIFLMYWKLYFKSV